MQVHTVPALRGWMWVREGFTLIWRAPVPIMPVSLLFLFTLVLLALPPGLGTIFPLLAWPGLSWGLMSVLRQVEQGRTDIPFPSLLYGAFRGPDARPRPMIQLGVFNLVTTFVAVLAAVLLTLSMDREPWVAFADAVTHPNASPDPITIPTPPIWAALAFMVVYGPAQMALWFAPLFVGQERTGVVKALIFSAITAWRNRRAFIVFWLGWFGVSTVAFNVAALLPGALGALAFSAVSMLMAVALYCSMWPTWRDTLLPGAAAPGPEPSTDP